MVDGLQGPRCYLGSKVTYVGQRLNEVICYNLPARMIAHKRGETIIIQEQFEQ